ncbi:hypothetical protein QCD79_24820 [Pseudomonas quasicaspiana]|nr:hypothetical protein [Pseudomonas quasicaspiana]
MATKAIPPAASPYAAGDIDPAFGVHGKLFIPDPSGAINYGLWAVAIFTDPKETQGRFFVYAHGGSTTAGPHYLVRLFKDGNIDSNFAANGYALIPSGDFETLPHPQAVFFHHALFDELGAVTLFGEVVEYHDDDFILLTALARLKSDGSVDENFGKDGFKTYKVPKPSGSILGPALYHERLLGGHTGTVLGSLNIQSASIRLIDGKITFLAFRYDDFARVHVASYVARIYATDGRLDESFGDHGLVLITDGVGATGSVVEGREFTVDAQGGITVAGDLRGKVIIVRYKFDGSLDDQFGEGGRVLLTPVAGESTSRGLKLGRDQRVLVLNTVFSPNRRHAELVVLRRNGTVDSSFNSGAPLVLERPAPDGFVATGLTEDDGGRIVVSGTKVDASGSSSRGTLIWRVMPVGTLDGSFGTDGLVTDSRYLMVSAVQIQSPANMVVSTITLTTDPKEYFQLLYRLIG